MSRICNRMVEIRASGPISLDDLEPQLPGCRYRKAKPCRIHYKHLGKITIQLFPKGCIQILGNVSEEDCNMIWTFLSKLLHPLTLSRPRTKSCTIQCVWKPRDPNQSTKAFLNNLASSTNISNEMELFPGTLITRSRVIRNKLRHYHCALFHNGTAIVTGVTNIPEAENVLFKCINQIYDSI